jgi:hypothetical protein
MFKYDLKPQTQSMSMYLSHVTIINKLYIVQELHKN